MAVICCYLSPSYTFKAKVELLFLPASCKPVSWHFTQFYGVINYAYYCLILWTFLTDFKVICHVFQQIGYVRFVRRMEFAHHSLLRGLIFCMLYISFHSSIFIANAPLYHSWNISLLVSAGSGRNCCTGSYRSRKIEVEGCPLSVSRPLKLFCSQLWRLSVYFHHL